MKTRIDINIGRLIELASFETGREEKLEFEKGLADFLEYAAVINSAHCENAVPAAHAVKKTTAYRDDRSLLWDGLESMLLNAPALQETGYLVPPQAGRKTAGDKNDSERTAHAKGTDYEAVIGLEVHAQLKTASKLFCGCSAAFGGSPNANSCPVCSGQPGTLPVLNREAVGMAVLLGLTVGSVINDNSIFSRKNYFYPDLPKGYQISQFEEPVCSGGSIDIETEGGIKKIRLNRVHMEEDAGKLVHVGAPGIWGATASSVDFNRTGVPLVEIVTEPDISTPAEAREYVSMLRAILMSLDICDGNMEEGSLRCDANVSLRPAGSKILGTKTEIKNMNSLKALERALEHEITRQKKSLANGIPVYQETRLWDESSQRTHIMRSKEESHDYRYFPDPDLLPVKLDQSWIGSLKERVVPLPLERKKKYLKDFGFTEVEARLFTVNPAYARYFEKVLERYSSPRKAANWFFTEILSYVKGNDITGVSITPDDLGDFLRCLDAGEISGKIGKDVIRKSFETRRGLMEIIAEEGLKMITDESEIRAVVASVLISNPDLVEEYRSGSEKVFGYFIGQVMKETQGKASPEITNRILRSRLRV